ncbi:MAG: adenylate kinase [Cocleimonas sp.]
MRILAFGPNGSGKGTQGTIIKERYGLDHIESGEIFRHHIKAGTELGLKAKKYIDEGNLVPDYLTIPMVVEALKKSNDRGWILDGFPRSLSQAKSLQETLQELKMRVDYVFEIELDREDAKKRIMGRRICAIDSNHPNHIAFEAIHPAEKEGVLVCRVCGGRLSMREDDQDEDAINQRHDIYYDEKEGTMAAVLDYRENCAARNIRVEGTGGISEIAEEILSEIEEGEAIKLRLKFG